MKTAEGTNPSGGVYRHRLVVPAAAVDPNGHVNNVEYVRWMQEAAVSHSNAAGCTSATSALGAQWVVRSHKIEYLRPLFANDPVLILTWVTNFRRARSLRKYRFVRSSDTFVVARGETDWVFIDATTGRPRAISDDVKRGFYVMPEDYEPSVVDLDPTNVESGVSCDGR